ncbi:BQ5605_C018g08626 [Microbotryum silenes-dioicae]|uniref:BQ5605_C018g08626 protein n=1 Tax=Microbotryum silenes-dioicae TaxID=796604 RepID=A0A2X0P0B3_9BASI|nr:BQ5605_C018g08626 [Microbotryum silenes-dioicae]
MRQSRVSVANTPQALTRYTRSISPQSVNLIAWERIGVVNNMWSGRRSCGFVSLTSPHSASSVHRQLQLGGKGASSANPASTPHVTQGLSRIVGVHRGAFRILPDFLSDDEVFEGIEPRALEVVFSEECYTTLDSVQDTEAMARVVLGVIHGEHPTTTSHWSLHRLGFLHRDVSTNNVMVDRPGHGVLIDYHLAVA